ncbi:hypothetical protein V6N13_009415 [Hibiscus sabdariffa]|uniref:Uncharacterized protein n=1 Tax=Hibiscus sabdariffa TaxID=183260 RepID=A0ABR2PNZ2_9ROSI
MTRRCSHCSNNGHNLRTRPTRDGSGCGGVKLFDVRLTDRSIVKKSASMGNLPSAHYHSSLHQAKHVKLFDVRLTDRSIIKKNASMGNLPSAHYHSSLHQAKHQPPTLHPH